MATITARNQHGEKTTVTATAGEGNGTDGYWGCEASEAGLEPGFFPGLIYLTTDSGVTLACDRGGMLESNGEPYAVIYHGRDNRSGVVLFND